jgi:hypothetical protein
LNFGIRFGEKTFMNFRCFIFAALCGFLTAGQTSPSARADTMASPSPQSAMPANPAIEKFGAAVTFYMSFDRLPLFADLSSGQPEQRENSELELRDGLYGKALLTNQRPEFNAVENLDLSKTGAVALWIAPYSWQREGDEPNLPFITFYDHGITLMLSRQGKVEKPRRTDMIFAYAAVGKESALVSIGASTAWQNGQWHLLAMNWRPGSFEASLDGAKFLRKDAPFLADAKGAPGRFAIGSKNEKDFNYLTDELLILDRPLEQSEIDWLWQTGQEKAAQNAAAQKTTGDKK